MEETDMQKVMITGIAGRFGKPTALALLEKGYQVAGSVRSREGKNAETVAELEAAGAEAGAVDGVDALNEVTHVVGTGRSLN